MNSKKIFKVFWNYMKKYKNMSKKNKRLILRINTYNNLDGSYF